MDPFEKKVIEKAVLVGLNAAIFSKEENATEETLDELEALLETAGGQCVAKVLQNRGTPDPHSFIGEGKVEENQNKSETQRRLCQAMRRQRTVPGQEQL